MKKFKCGFCSVSFRKNTAQEVIRAAASAGLECIEWGSDVHVPYDDAKKLQEIVELQREYGIACSSYGTYFRLGETPIDELSGYITAAKTLGTDLVRLWCGTKGSAVTEQEEETELFDVCKEAAKIAEDAGVTLAMECHNWTYTDTAESIVRLMEAVDSKNFRMYWQPNQYRSFEENISHIETTGKYVTAVHAFNWSENERFPLADAVGTWRDYLARLDGEHPLLLEFMPDDSIESLAAEAAALREIIKGE